MNRTYLVGADRIVASSAKDLVHRMHKLSHTPAANDAVWMVQAARRAMTQSGALVRVNSAEAFVADLIAAGLIKEIE